MRDTTLVSSALSLALQAGCSGSIEIRGLIRELGGPYESLCVYVTVDGRARVAQRESPCFAPTPEVTEAQLSHHLTVDLPNDTRGAVTLTVEGTRAGIGDPGLCNVAVWQGAVTLTDAQPPPMTLELRDVSTLDPRDALVADEAVPTMATLNAIWSPGPNEAIWAVGSQPMGSGVILRCGPGCSGASSAWQTTVVPSTNSVNALWGPDRDDIWAVGNGGAILHYTGDPGLGWVRQDCPAFASLWLISIWGTSQDDVWIAGEDTATARAIMLHRDGASRCGWHLVTAPKTTLAWEKFMKLSSVWQSDPGHLWAAAQSLGVDNPITGTAFLLHEVGDPEDRWRQVSTQSALFINAGWGRWAVGQRDKSVGHANVVRWNGKTWCDPVAKVSDQLLQSIWGLRADGCTPGADRSCEFADDSASREAVFVAGAGRTILRQDNWRWWSDQSQQGLSYTIWRGVWAAAREDIWMVGEHGVIRHAHWP